MKYVGIYWSLFAPMMVFQDVVLFDDIVLENIRLGKHGASGVEVLAAARTVNCDEFVEKLQNANAGRSI